MSFVRRCSDVPYLVMVAIYATLMLAGVSCAQSADKPLEVTDDGSPVLLQHLPLQAAVNTAKFIKSREELSAAVGGRAVLSAIDFTGGTEAVSAIYPAGTLLIIEYTNPQSSIASDQKILESLSSSSDRSTVYRRIGNYNAFVFDATDAAAASSLLDQVKYEKSVQWLGEDPFYLEKAQKYLVTSTRDIFVWTVIAIVTGLGTSVLLGLIAGYFYFRFRDARRHRSAAFSDAGGLTRLNIDELRVENF